METKHRPCRFPRSPSPTSPATIHHRFTLTPSSASPAAADPQHTACKDSSSTIEDPSYVQGGEEGLGHKRSQTATDSANPADDVYSWRKYGEKMTSGSKFPRKYYRCPHRLILDCRARKHVQQLSEDPPRYKTSYRGQHTCKNPPQTPQTTHASFSKNHETDSSIVLNLEESTTNNATPKTMPLPSSSTSTSTSSYPSYSMDFNSTYGGGLDVQCTVQDEIPFSNEFFGLSEEDFWNPIKDESNIRTMMEMDDCYSIFFLLPEDYEFEEDTVVHLWMAGEHIEDEHMGHHCFSGLLNTGYMIHSGIDFVTRKNRYKMNIKKIKILLDVQDDNGSSYLKWDNKWEYYDMTNSAEIQHVSVVCDDIDATTFEALGQFNQLRTLLFLHNYGSKVLRIPDYMFQRLNKLQALDLSGTHIKKLPSSVGCMIHLRYLDLSRTLLEWLPDTICSLHQLQTLKLRGCSKLRGLPRQLKRLTKLRHLDVDILRQLATIPKGIGALVNLRTLSGFLVGTEEGCKIQELKELNSLTGEFCIAMLENISNADEAKEAALIKKQHLDRLQLRWTESQLSTSDNNCYNVLEHLQPCSSLEELKIFCYEGSGFPHWVGDTKFSQLVIITFFKCERVSELPVMEQLPCLKHLELVKMNGVKKIERRGESERSAFFRLEKLEINEMQSLEAWRWVKTNEDDFKNLVEITINDCPELREFRVLSCLSSIKHLDIRECTKLESLSDMKLPDSLKDLIVEDCPRIKKKCLQQGGEDWYKIQHVSNIRICMDDDDNDDDGDDDE